MSLTFLVNINAARNCAIGRPGSKQEKKRRFPRLAEAFSIRVAVSYRYFHVFFLSQSDLCSDATTSATGRNPSCSGIIPTIWQELCTDYFESTPFVGEWCEMLNQKAQNQPSTRPKDVHGLDSSSFPYCSLHPVNETPPPF